MIYTGYASYSDEELIDFVERRMTEGPERSSMPYIELIRRLMENVAESEEELKSMQEDVEFLEKQVKELETEPEDYKLKETQADGEPAGDVRTDGNLEGCRI